MEVLEIKTREILPLRVDGKDYTVEYPLHIVAEMEKLLGHSMRDVLSWIKLPTAELPIVLELGLRTNHEAEAAGVAATICTALETEAIEEVIAGLARAQFPKAMARLDKAVEDAREAMRKGITLPNAPSADAS